eukprot:COSAG02_NODE_36182_length_458_cov_0.660167_2_plen_23_part_01
MARQWVAREAAEQALQAAEAEGE